ncbi:NADH-quinone oxidoreductase subunit C [Microbacterium sp. STN6]|uniref:hydrogenase large subunit n=1 Tax=Microbacterium sp. STN6 TaxID=2995588 RepID=UPI002260D560|nr:NADH-quinone oxidoreductase subunit C [Microbacterium sp. STN6]MCX7520869.1 NADH-quinone oxidoreductase subunit C [Microbacterium sp. STN6]
MSAPQSVRTSTATDPAAFTSQVNALVRDGSRFAGLYGTARRDGCELTALLADTDRFTVLRTLVTPDAHGELHFPSLTPHVLAAFWYERAAHDLSGVVADGHPRLDPLLVLIDGEYGRPHPGRAHSSTSVSLRTPPGPVDVHGRGMFTIPLGPVRSGVFESVEFLIETPGEDIPHLNIRPHYKHRGVAKRFEGRSIDDGVLIAERVEGIASVAHALAYSHAVEAMSGAVVPPKARLLRVVYAELERMANHLDVAMRLAEAAGLAVATSRFAWHKESVMRLVSELCGNRFGRSAVVPGGVAGMPSLDLAAAARALRAIHERVRRDAALAMKTPSFLDRLRGTGILPHDRAAEWASLGPVGRASRLEDDCRWRRPTDAYAELPLATAPPILDAGDVQARMLVRWREIDQSAVLVLAALQRLDREPDDSMCATIDLPEGEAFGIGWSEAPQGEVLYAVTVQDSIIRRCFARSASLHNLAAFHEVFRGDVFTDFAFIEASFGTGYAGVAM